MAGRRGPAGCVARSTNKAAIDGVTHYSDGEGLDHKGEEFPTSI